MYAYVRFSALRASFHTENEMPPNREKASTPDLRRERKILSSPMRSFWPWMPDLLSSIGERNVPDLLPMLAHAAR